LFGKKPQSFHVLPPSIQVFPACNDVGWGGNCWHG
jgi:hypothetical protein